MRKMLLTLGILVVLSLSAYASNDTEVKIVIDDTQVEFTDAKPFVDSANRTQVPVRAVMESFDAEVIWEQERNAVIIYKNGNMIELPIGEKYILVNSQKQEIDTAAQLYRGRTYLPIRAVVEALGGEVGWDDITQTVLIKKGVSERNNSQEYLAEETDIISYESFRDMFEYEAIQQNDYVWAYATYTRNLGRSDFEKLWSSIPDRNKEIYMKRIALEKQGKNAEYAIIINYCYGRSGPFVEIGLGSSSCSINGKLSVKIENINTHKLNSLD